MEVRRHVAGCLLLALASVGCTAREADEAAGSTSASNEPVPAPAEPTSAKRA